jgi:hypothetical protein
VTELWECIQAASLMWIVVGFALALWPLEWAIRRLIERRREQRQRMRRLELAELYWAQGCMVWLSDTPSRIHAVFRPVLPDCLEPREPQRQDVPAAFRRAFGEE